MLCKDSKAFQTSQTMWKTLPFHADRAISSKRQQQQYSYQPLLPMASLPEGQSDSRPNPVYLAADAEITA